MQNGPRNNQSEFFNLLSLVFSLLLTLAFCGLGGHCSEKNVLARR